MVVIFRMRNKTIAFVGDSLGRQQFQSMMCMVSGGEHIIYVEDAAREYGLVKPRGAKRPDGWVYRFTKTNTTILYYWSASLSDLVPINSTDKASDVAMHLDRPPAFLRRYLHRFDVLVLNTGHHWNRGKFEGNRWVMHVNGKPNENKEFEDIRNAKNFTVHTFVRWLDSQLTSHPRLKAFFRTISPRHYRNGDWNTGGTCNNTIPLTYGSEVLQDGSNDKVVESAVRGTKVKLLDITAISELRDEAHIYRTFHAYGMKRQFYEDTTRSCAEEEMKGGDGFRTTGKKISVAMLALVWMTLLLWDWETNPFVYTHVSTQYQSNTPPGIAPACIHCDPNNSTESMEPAEMKTDGDKYQSLEKEEGKEPMKNGDD
ncbi:hypothetical protein Goari_020933, partial [Gossypium aridum]|nr:hypothetical protein [Gossypium aridum]